MPSKLDALDAIVVLGCRVGLDEAGRLHPQLTLAGRLDAAAAAYARRGGGAIVVVASGGRHWGGLVEADVMARELVARGVPERVIVRERRSLSTRDNARFTAQELAQRGIARVALVTSEWHLPRALALFRQVGMVAEGVAARERSVPLSRRLWRRARERVLLWAQTAPSHRIRAKE